MDTSQFLQIGDDAETIFNVAHITAVQRKSIPITAQNRKAYTGYEDSIQNDTIHSIFVYVVDARGGMEYIYPSEAIRDARFEEIRATLKPMVLTGTAEENDNHAHEPAPAK